MRRMFTAAVAAGITLAASLAAAAPTPWEPVRQGEGREGISTWARPAEGLAVKEFKGVTEVHASIVQVLAVIADVPNLSSWIFNCKRSEHPEGTPANQQYMQFRGIWPASDRDALVQTVALQREDRSVLIASDHVDGFPPRDGYVRMPYLHNEFRLYPLEGGWTRVEFETRIDLGGLVPTWLANLVSTNAPLVTLEGLKRELAKPRYQGVKSALELPRENWRGPLLVVPAEH